MCELWLWLVVCLLSPVLFLVSCVFFPLDDGVFFLSLIFCFLSNVSFPSCCLKSVCLSCRLVYLSVSRVSRVSVCLSFRSWGYVRGSQVGA